MTRSPGVPAAVSMSTMTGLPVSVIIRQIVSPWTPGQVPVQDEHVVVVEVELEGGVHAVVGDVDGHALITQALGDVVGQPPDILGDQDPHRAAPARPAGLVGPVRIGGGQVDDRAQAAFGPGAQAQRPAVRGGDRVDDRQPQAGSGRRAGTVGAQPPERLGQAGDLVLVEDGAGVFHQQPRGCPVAR